LVQFPPDVVTSLRHMVTRLTRGAELPARISVIAALREEGVTYITVALAATMATDLEATICAVELNWWWPGMSTLLSGTESPGLAGVLAGQSTLDDALIATNLPNLSLLPAGDLPIEWRPVVARGAALAELIYQMHDRFQYLVLDIPAVRATSDAIALAGLGAACCLVLRQGATPAMEVRTALDDVSNLSMLGVVMNRVRIATPAFFLRMIPRE
jgi:Mrp family chromosome partitioning ATPase